MTQRSTLAKRLIGLIVLWVLMGSPVHARTPSRDAPVDVSRFRGWEVSSFAIDGPAPRISAVLRRGLALNGKRSLFLVKRPLLFRDVLADDLSRARIFMAQIGYPHAVIDVEFKPERKNRKVGVVFRIASGPAVTIEKLTINGQPSGFDSGQNIQSSLVEGRRFREADLNQAVTRLRDALAESGYPRATVDSRLSLIDSTHTTIDLDIEAGPRCRFDGTRVDGAPDDLRDLVLRNARPDEGVLYSPEWLRRARRNVRELDLFRRVDVRAGEPNPDTVDLMVGVVPRKMRSTDLDVGYWSDDFLRTSARWRHRNLFGRGRGAELKGALSRYRRDAGFNTWWLSLFGPRTRLSARLQYVLETEDGYDLRSHQAELWASKRMGRIGQFQTGLTVADVSVDVPPQNQDLFRATDGLLTILHLRLNNSNYNNPVDPTGGLSWSGRLEWAPAWVPGDYNFALAAGELVRYQALGGAVLATRLEAGVAQPLGSSDDLLPNKRFFAGGSTSMRGARRRMLGPLDETRTPIGGEIMLIASSELRFKIKGGLRGALFMDTGNAWRYANDTALDDIEVAVGPGLMFMTPVGPVRADAGYNLTQRPDGEPGMVFHLTIGHPF
jgi:outer membrane protein assembly factor BamA